MKTKAELIVDLDGTILNTECTERVRSNRYGREFLANNIDSFQTDVYSANLIKLINSYHKEGRLIVATNSPRDYARAVMKKHGLDPKIPLLSAANKPFASNPSSRRPQETLIVGDSAKDILWAHELQIASVAVDWGYDSTPQKLKLAEPSKQIQEPDELEDIVKEFENGSFGFAARTAPAAFHFAAPDRPIDPQMRIIACGDYIPYRSGCRDAFSDNILGVKDLKNYEIDEINNGGSRLYWYSGALRRGDNLLYLYNWARDLFLDELANINGTVDIVASPNSLPGCCYKFEYLRSLASSMEKESDTYSFVKRGLIRRIFPKESDHNSGRSTRRIQLETMGMRDVDLPTADTIVVIDDVTTSGNQMLSVGQMLRERGYSGNLVGIALGQTYSEF